MSSKIQALYNSRKLAGCLPYQSSTHYEVIMGSYAYGCNDSDKSDVDIYSFCIPPRAVVFPHEAGHIQGFGTPSKRFDQYQLHGTVWNDKEYDISVYNIVKYFQLCMENNPNIIDSLFVPERCILHITKIGQMVREFRRHFLHKGAWFKFKGYAYSQWKKAQSSNRSNPERAANVEKYGYDLKFAYHIVRLLDEIEQILTYGDISLDSNREELKSIRNGQWTWEDINKRFDTKRNHLEGLYETSKLQHKPDEKIIKNLLMNCLEEHYGSLDACYKDSSIEKQIIQDVLQTLRKYGVA